MKLQESPTMVYSASEMRAMTEGNLMESQFELGNLDGAWAHIVGFESESAHPDYDLLRERWSTRMKDVKGSILLRRGDVDGAEEIGNDCLGVATRHGWKKYVGKAQRLLGQISTRRGPHDLAEARLRGALTRLEEVGNPRQLWITHAAAARLYEAMKRPDREREHWQAAVAVVRSTAEGLREEGLRETFLAAAPVREILDQANR